MESLNKEPGTGFAIISHFYFGFALDYIQAALKAPIAKDNLDSRILASILFSFFSLEAYINEFFAFNSLLDDKIKKNKPSLTDKIKKLANSSITSKEPYNSTRILEHLRHSLVHFNPEFDFNKFTENGVLKISSTETWLEAELSTRQCIEECSNIAISEFRGITLEGAKWATDTVYLMVRQIDKIATEKRMKSIYRIFMTNKG